MKINRYFSLHTKTRFSGAHGSAGSHFYRLAGLPLEGIPGTKLSRTMTRDVRHRRDGPRGKLHGNAALSLRSGRAGQKAHYGRDTATVRLVRRAGASDPQRSAGPCEVASRSESAIAAPSADTGPRARTLGPTSQDHLPANSAIAGKEGPWPPRLELAAGSRPERPPAAERLEVA